ncbi:MAG: hypothetical protein LH619_12810 [Chitinophagaceae bacterium]|nr:hypothetical protein [Chitinophagaceae bacterium]
MPATTQSKAQRLPQDSWEKQEDVITQNDVIDAYLHGRKQGRTDYQIAMNNLFEANLTRAQQASEKLYEDLKNLSISVDSIHLKADAVTNFMALIVADTKNYLDDNFLKGIRAGRKIKTTVDSSDFIINFIFTHNTKTLNEDFLDSDGYFLKYYGQ